MLWIQGWDSAPDLVQRCLRSWQHHNPGWTIRLLDAETFSECTDLSVFLPVAEDVFLVQSFPDLVRLCLIKTHGGVWTDATCFCRRPLDDWLFDYLRSGFFSFERNGHPSSWFFAGAPGNRAIDIWWDEVRNYWIDCPPGLRASLTNPRLIDRLIERMQKLGAGRMQPKRAVDRPLRTLGKLLEQHQSIRLSPLFRNVLKNAPYYWLAMVFMICCRKHLEMRRIWDGTPKLRAAGLIELGGFPGLYAPVSDQARRAIDEQRTPVYKLNWRADLAKAGPESFLEYLFATVPTPLSGTTTGPSSTPTLRPRR